MNVLGLLRRYWIAAVGLAAVAGLFVAAALTEPATGAHSLPQPAPSHLPSSAPSPVPVVTVTVTRTGSGTPTVTTPSVPSVPGVPTVTVVTTPTVPPALRSSSPAVPGPSSGTPSTSVPPSTAGPTPHNHGNGIPTPCVVTVDHNNVIIQPCK